MADDALTESMKRLGEIAHDYFAAHAPSGKIGASFRLRMYGANVHLISTLIEARMTQTGDRHPVFATGPRSTWNWAPENERSPQRTGWADRLADEAADAAIDRAADVYVARITAEIR